MSERSALIKLYKIAKAQQEIIKKLAGSGIASNFAETVNKLCNGKVRMQVAGRSLQLTLVEGTWVGAFKSTLVGLLDKPLNEKGETYKKMLKVDFDEVQLYEGTSTQPDIIHLDNPTLTQ